MGAVHNGKAIAPTTSDISKASAPRHSKRKTKFSQIIPTGPTVEEVKLESKRALGRQQGGSLSFHQAFGVLGFPMLCILILCVAWTAWLIFLALAPNKAANMLMDTSAYDNGEFWLIHDISPGMTIAGAIGLIVVNISYVFVTLRMLLWREKLFSSAFVNQSSNWIPKPLKWLDQPKYKRARLLWDDLTSFEGKNRKRWNALLKLIDLSMETVMLRQLLTNGSPASLTYGFTIFLAVNSMSCVINVLTDRFSALTEVFIDSIFDLAAAVLFPIVTLVHSYYNFDFDRDGYLTYLEVLPPGSFEHLARSFVDQSELALFRVNFDSLRIDSLLDFVLRISMNLTFCYRFERVLQAILWTRHRERIIQQKMPQNTHPARHNHVPKGITAIFVACSVVVLLSANKAMTDSAALCSAYPECVVYTHKWESTDKSCPCLILIDVDRAPKTYEEWISPVDSYDKVKALAASGMLRSIQIINRQLLEWPEELRYCHELKVIQLMYTSTQHIPSWAKDFKQLETIQIEGKYGSRNLENLPEDLFSYMPRLSMIHFGLHEHIDHLPPFTGIPHLQSLSIAWITQLTELPAFDHIPELSRLILALLLNLEWLPDMAPLQNLVEFVVLRPNHICCNGFLGTCDLNYISCHSYPLANVSAAACLKNDTNSSLAVTPFLGNIATKKAFEKFAPFICQPSSFDPVDFLGFPTKDSIEMCDGKPFRECFLPGNRSGICYNTRFTVLSCLPDPHYIELRRLQIAKHVGPKCDPVEEKWLGCGA